MLALDIAYDEVFLLSPTKFSKPVEFDGFKSGLGETLADSRNSIVLRFRTRFLVASSVLSGQRILFTFTLLIVISGKPIRSTISLVLVFLTYPRFASGSGNSGATS